MRKRFNPWLLLFFTLILTGSSLLQTEEIQERARFFTRPLEFDFTRWTLQAIWTKWEQRAVGGAAFLPPESRTQVVLDYHVRLEAAHSAENALQEALADPSQAHNAAELGDLRARLNALKAQRDALAPWAESVLETQVGEVLSKAGLTLGGQPIPPVLFHITQPPQALIVSPRQVIRQDADISILPDLSPEAVQTLETQVASAFDVSTLVVGIGGVGVYPTMVLESGDVNWLSEVIAHEWIHNYLSWHPLGALYNSTPEMRTINETTASLAGKALGQMVIAANYPALQAAPAPPPAPPATDAPSAPPAFDFQHEMHHTRVVVDALLAAGKTKRAEWYMEVRRRYFWENGYHLRKLNQAYFAFYGAYADAPAGAAGEDPVGAAVRALWTASDGDAGRFVHRMAWVWSYEHLQALLNGGG
ncbi:MAG: hypothetical protein Fur0018_05380 [Anaerolineales bacterium]